MRFSERENYHKISIYIILEKYFSLFFIVPKGCYKNIIFSIILFSSIFKIGRAHV